MKDYTFFIALSYAIAAIGVFGAIAAILLDYRALRQALHKIGAPVDGREDDPS